MSNTKKPQYFRRKHDTNNVIHKMINGGCIAAFLNGKWANAGVWQGENLNSWCWWFEKISEEEAFLDVMENE